jgi:CrcB protein
MKWSHIALMAGGAAGVAARAIISHWLETKTGHHLPWGTIFVNVSGCFLIGFLSGLTAPAGVLPAHPVLRDALLVGVLGGYTTFSSFSLQTVHLLNEGRFFDAFGHVFATVAFCLLATWLGLRLAPHPIAS